jgi:hypothetical protein
MTLTRLTARRERERNLLFLSTPRLWPAYPLLPVVRRTGAGGEECGLLMDLAGLFGLYGYGSTVFLANLYDLPDTLARFLALPRRAFDSADEVFDAGWRVD